MLKKNIYNYSQTICVVYFNHICKYIFFIIYYAYFIIKNFVGIIICMLNASASLLLVK